MHEEEVVERAAPPMDTTPEEPVALGGHSADSEESPAGSTGTPPDDSADLSGTAPDKATVLEALKNVYDPELGINIVDLGLVYEVVVRDGDVDITYSLTTMGCPIGPLIEQQMQQFLDQVPGVERVNAEMVLRPPWSPEMMSDEAKAALGVF